jgi:hypothetical protein
MVILSVLLIVGLRVVAANPKTAAAVVAVTSAIHMTIMATKMEVINTATVSQMRPLSLVTVRWVDMVPVAPRLTCILSLRQPQKAITPAPALRQFASILHTLLLPPLIRPPIHPFLLLPTHLPW